MTLDEAYQALGLRPPWDWERSSLSHGRRSGSTTHMLIELYLDMEQARRGSSPLDLKVLRFYVVCLSVSHARLLRHELRQIHEKLRSPFVDITGVLMVPSRTVLENLRGRMVASWGVFCDHAVKSQEPSFGPFRYIRSIRAVLGGGDSAVALDRDNNVLCHFQQSEINGIIESTSIPIVLDIAREVVPIAYPAWTKDIADLRYRSPFSL